LKYSRSSLTLFFILIFASSPLRAGKYYVLCEGNFLQSNASLWSIDESLQTINGPLIWDANDNPLGDTGQSLTLFEHTLYIVMNGSHEVRVVDLESGEQHVSDIEIPNSSPRFMAIHRESGLGYISSWSLSALLIVDLESYAVIDTFSVGAKPEEVLIVGDELFVSLVQMSDSFDAENQVLRIDLQGHNPEITHTYEVIDGPGAMALVGDELYVTSIYYNDAWETYSGTSRINISDHTVTSVDHGYYTNFVADIDIIDGLVYRTYGSSLVPLNDDLTLNSISSLLNMDGIYSHKLANSNILVGSSNDFVAPDSVTVFSQEGQELAEFTVGALPSHSVYYSSEIVAINEGSELPTSISLGSNYPNPFNPSTTVPFSIDISADVTLRIYDIKGSLVATLINRHLSAGNYAVDWDGINTNGVLMSSGVYHAVLSTEIQNSSIKLHLLK